MESILNRDPIEVFISYAHKDEAYRQQLEAHLSVLQREGTIAAWHDRQIQPGSNWSSEIDSHLRTAHIILLLVSADFLHSDYCYAEEMQLALARHGSGSAKVIPIILRPCDWTKSLLGRLQALPLDAKPVTSWVDRDEAFLDIVQGLRVVVDQIFIAANTRHHEVVGDRHKSEGAAYEVSKPISRPWVRAMGARLLPKRNVIAALSFFLFLLFVTYVGLQVFLESRLPVEGHIKRITSDLIELNIGSEDGVTEGLTMLVFGLIDEIEGDVLVGQIRVNKVESHRSTAEVIERIAPFRNGWKVQEQQQ